LADRILDAIRYAPLDDDMLARRLGVGHRQAVNQAARRLEAQGRLCRFTIPDGKIVNALPDSQAQQFGAAIDQLVATADGDGELEVVAIDIPIGLPLNRRPS
jgi:hypothetical protein